MGAEILSVRFMRDYRIHLGYWVGLVLFFSIIWGTYDQDYIRNFMIQLWSLPARLLAVYLTVWVLVPRFFNKELYLRFSLSFSLLLTLISIGVQRPVMLFIVEGVYLPYHSEDFFNTSQLMNTVIDVGLATCIPLSFVFFQYWKSSNQKIAELSKETEQLNRLNSTKWVIIKSGNVKHRLNAKETIFIESLRNYLKVKTLEKEILSYGSISEMSDTLGFDTFCRIHRSYIVNLDHLESYSTNAVVVKGTKLPIGRKYKASFIEKLN